MMKESGRERGEGCVCVCEREREREREREEAKVRESVRSEASPIISVYLCVRDEGERCSPNGQQKVWPVMSRAPVNLQLWPEPDRRQFGPLTMCQGPMSGVAHMSAALLRM